MSLNLDEKKAVVAEISAKVAQAQTIVLAEYRGLEVGDMTELRAKARKAGVYLRVLKNTLARRAVTGTPFESLADQMVGPLAYGISDRSGGSREGAQRICQGERQVRHQGRRNADQVMTSAKEVATLATMPSREELLAKLWERCRRRLRSLFGHSTRCRASSCVRLLPSGIKKRSRLRKSHFATSTNCLLNDIQEK